MKRGHVRKYGEIKRTVASREVEEGYLVEPTER